MHNFILLKKLKNVKRIQHNAIEKAPANNEGEENCCCESVLGIQIRLKLRHKT